MSRDPSTILLCSLRFWSQQHGPDNPTARVMSTVRSGVRHVARKQGITPVELNKAERQLVRDGLMKKTGPGAISLTERGLKQSRGRCEGVELKPWDWSTSYRGLAGARRRKKRRK